MSIKIVVTLNINKEITYLKSDIPLSKGRVVIRYEFDYPQNLKIDTTGKETLYINDVKVAERALLKKEGLVFEYDEGLDIGRDNQSAVSPLYKPPFVFTGKLNKVTIDFK